MATKVRIRNKTYTIEGASGLDDALDKAIEEARHDEENEIYDKTKTLDSVKDRLRDAGVPSETVDYRSAADLRNIDAQVTAASQQRAQMDEAKHSLMSEQLTGKTRDELTTMSEQGDIEGFKDLARQVGSATAPTLDAVRAERDRIEARRVAAEAQRRADEETARQKYDPKNLTSEMRDRLTTWVDDPNNPTVGWATMADKLNINPQAVIEAKRQLKETISKIPGAGQTVENILTGQIWNNPIVTNVIRQMVDSPQGRRWEGDVGVVYKYLAGRDMSTGKQQADASMATFRSEGHGVTGGPGRHPTQTYNDFDEYQMALKSGMSLSLIHI